MSDEVLLDETKNTIIIHKLPRDFDEKDTERIELFVKRIKYIREKRRNQVKEKNASTDLNYQETRIDYNISYTQQDLASYLGLKSMSISKYETGKIKSIPLKHLRKICEFYDVSIHYILGYVDEEHVVLELDSEGNPVLDKFKKFKTLIEPMSFYPTEFQDLFEKFKKAIIEDKDFYYTVSKLSLASEDERKRCIDILNILL